MNELFIILNQMGLLNNRAELINQQLEQDLAVYHAKTKLRLKNFRKKYAIELAQADKKIKESQSREQQCPPEFEESFKKHRFELFARSKNDE